jgi:zinc transport system permease protein
MVAIAIIFASKIPDAAIVETMLFGDIFSFTKEDLYIIISLDFLVLILLAKFLKPLMLVSVNSDLARVQKISVSILEFMSLLILALVVTVTIKNIGALLITALLVIPAATARIFSTTPTKMIIYSIIIALFSAILGLYASFQFDLPLASSVAIISVALYILAACINFKRRGII